MLYDLVQAQDWTDVFTIASGEQQCEVVLARNNKVDAEHPRALTVKLKERDHEISGTLEYAEANQPNGGCTLNAAVSGSVTAPPPAAQPPLATPTPPQPQLGSPGNARH